MNRLKELRTEKGLTQQELADVVDVTKLTIANWENEKHKIKSDKAQQLADYFGVSVGNLLGYEDFYNIQDEALDSYKKIQRLLQSNADLKKIILEYDESNRKQGKFNLSLQTDTDVLPLIEQNIIDLILQTFHEEHEGEYDEEVFGTLSANISNTYIALGKLPLLLSDFLGSFLTLSTANKKAVMTLVKSIYEKDQGKELAEEYSSTYLIE